MTIFVIFDIDGTLTRTRLLDEQSYDKALNDVFNIELTADARKRINESADSGLLNAICLSYLGVLPSSQQLKQFQSSFFYHLESALKNEAAVTINGAQQLLLALRQLPGVDIAFATGAWRRSALLKLQYANIQINPDELTSADEEETKQAILSLAIKKKQIQWPYSATYYVGDRHWDYEAASALSIDFVGVGDDPFLLECVDKKRCLQDLSNLSDFLELIAYE